MPDHSFKRFEELEKLIDSIAGGAGEASPRINHADLLAELGVIKQLVEVSAFPDIDSTIPDFVRPSVTGPETRVRKWSLPDLVKTRWTGPEIIPPEVSFPDHAGVTGPEVGTDRCPVCKRKY
ncbi:hypothetical protein [Qipengyuania mesophila]|uniref:hypothetical protein n=1 Tax=Qipengyuania mesophila TaxID=2867246 RepID=UPI00351801DD